MNHSSYLDVMNHNVRAQRTITICERITKELGNNFDAVAFSGISGVLVGINVADLLHKPFIIVRKEGEASHGREVEGSIGHQPNLRYIIVDDMIATGRTIRRMIHTIDNDYSRFDPILTMTLNTSAKCVGIFLHQDRGSVYDLQTCPRYGGTTDPDDYNVPVFCCGI